MSSIVFGLCYIWDQFTKGYGKVTLLQREPREYGVLYADTCHGQTTCLQAVRRSSCTYQCIQLYVNLYNCDTPRRKHEDVGASQRRVAQRLQLSADAGDAFEVVQSTMEKHLRQYKETQRRVVALERLQVATELTTQFQTLCCSELDAVEDSRLPAVHQRLDRILQNLSNKKTPEQKLEKVCRRLPKLMTRAEKVIADQRQLIAEQAQLPGPHQWVPPVLWRLYDDSVAAAARNPEMKPLKDAMHEVMAVQKEKDPLFYLQVLYQPPPPHLDGKWEVAASEKLTAICASMTPFFRDLKKRSYALKDRKDMNIRINCGWNQLRVTMTFVHRAARHFHFLVLHLYAVAMGCASPSMTAGIISEKAVRGIFRARHELRSRLRIHQSADKSMDYLVKETYEWTPELLVFLDEWRRHEAFQDTLPGFCRDKEARNFLPYFNYDGRKLPKRDVLAEIGDCLTRAEYAWQSSGLGTAKFKVMRIKDIGRLENRIKKSLGVAVATVYNMMLARWLDRRRRPLSWWASLQLREDFDPTEVADNTNDFLPEEAQSASCMGNQADEHVVDTNAVPRDESTEQDKSVESQGEKYRPSADRFRSPTKVTIPLRPVASSAEPSLAKKLPTNGSSSPSVVDEVAPQPLVRELPILIREIYSWTDQEIKEFNHKTERIEDVRAAMLKLSARLELDQVELGAKDKAEAGPEFGESIRDDWRLACLVTRSHSLSRTAAAYAEEVVLHDAANALVKRPALRVKQEKVVQDCVADDDTDRDGDELLEAVCAARKNVARMLTENKDIDSSTCREHVQSVARSSLQLLRLISQGVEREAETKQR